MEPKISAESAIEPALDLLKEYIRSSITNGIKFNAGELIQVGWTWFRIDNIANELVVTAPELYKMPMNFTPDCSAIVNLIAQQRYICDSFSQPIEECNARQSAIVPYDLLDCNEVFINRTNRADNTVSGWFVGAGDSKADPNNHEDYELKSLWEISCLFPTATEFFLLPVNWQVVLKGKPIVLNNFNEVKSIDGSFYNQKYES